MLQQIKQLLEPPTFAAEDKTRAAALLHLILLTTISITVLAVGAFALSGTGSKSDFILLGAILLFVLGGFLLLYRGYIKFASLLFTLIMWGLTTLAIIINGTLNTISPISYIFIIVVAGLLLGSRAGLTLAGLSSLIALGIVYAEWVQIISPLTSPNPPLQAWIVMTGNCIMIAMLLHLNSRRLTQALARVQHNEQALAAANKTLQQEFGERKQVEMIITQYQEQLEELVQQRTAELQRKVTEHQQTKDALRASQDRFRSIVESVTVPLIITRTADKKTLYINKYMLEMLAISEADFLNPQTSAFYYESTERANVVNLLQTQGFVHNHEVQLTRANGDLFWAMASAQVTEIDGDLAYLGTFYDITERKQAEESLAEERNLLRTLINRLPDYIYAKDRNSRFIMVNSAEVTLLGQTSVADVLGKSDFDFFPEELATVYYADEQNLMHVGRELIDHEEPVIDQDNNDIWFLSTKVPLRDEQDQVIGLVGIGRDITERKRTEQMLQNYSERLEEMVAERTKALHAAQEKLVRQGKLAVLGQLGGGLAHELRNPLAVIHNSVYFLQMVLPDANEMITDHLAIIADRVDESERIISALLDASRTRPAKREFVTLSTLLSAVLDSHPAPEQIKVDFDDIRPDLPAVFVDAQQIKQVVINLVTNAYQAMPEGGYLRCRATTEQNMLTLFFSDTGHGMSAETLEKIFEPLFTTKGRGIGLGLALSKNLVDVNGGKISAESTLGQGTTFMLELPLSS